MTTKQQSSKKVKTRSEPAQAAVVESAHGHPFPETRIEDVAGCLKYTGKPKTIEEMNEAITLAVIDRHKRGRY